MDDVKFLSKATVTLPTNQQIKFNGSILTFYSNDIMIILLEEKQTSRIKYIDIDLPEYLLKLQ